MALRKKGPDVRNNNWLFYNNQLLASQTGITPSTEQAFKVVTPEEAADIITDGERQILDAIEQMYQQNRAKSPTPTSSVSYGWLNTIKIAPAGEGTSRGTALTASAYDRLFSETVFYDPHDLLPGNREYMELFVGMGYTARLLTAFAGWNEVRDGAWLQIQHPEQGNNK